MRAEKFRVTQAERSSRTRGALIEAAVKVLATQGYARASTNKIVRKARLSRGALMHHFSSKSELIAATVRYIFLLKEAEYKEKFSQLPKDQRNLENAVNLLWQIMDGEAFKALNELLLAARTDQEVAVVIEPLFKDLLNTLTKIFYELFPQVATGSFGESIPAFAFATIQGALVLREMGLRDTAEDVVEILKLLAKFVVPNLEFNEIEKELISRKEVR